MAGRVLTVAESDCSGSAGIQADIKTILALGGYATTAVSTVTVQSTERVLSSFPLAPEVVAEQMRCVLQDIGTDAVKIGFLTSEAMVNAVSDVLDETQKSNVPVIVDPSIVTRDGRTLVDDAAIAAWKRRLYVRTTVLTPNLREAELLTGMKIKDIDDMRHATDMMRTLAVENVILKAGRAMSGKELYLVATEDGEKIYERPVLDTKYTLGAGCTMASAIAISLAQGMDVFKSVERALDFMHQAMLHAPGYGKVAGPINHAFNIERAGAFVQSESVKVHNR